MRNFGDQGVIEDLMTVQIFASDHTIYFYAIFYKAGSYKNATFAL